MNDRPTPETDAVVRNAATADHPPTRLAATLTVKCEKLERERDEAREAAAKWESSFNAVERAGAEQARRADENREWALRSERERDEAREQLSAAKHFLEKYIVERDEAREALQRIADCDFVITLPDRMDAVRKIANDALKN
jgi:hypothetical protein